MSKETLNDIEHVVDIIKAEYQKYTDDSKISKKMKLDVTENDFEYTISMNIESYWKYIEYGRRKGKKPPPVKVISEWMRTKKGFRPRPIKGKMPTKKTLSFMISRSIGKKGIRPRPFFRQNMPRILHKMPIETIMANDLNNQIVDMLNTKLSSVKSK